MRAREEGTKPRDHTSFLFPLPMCHLAPLSTHVGEKFASTSAKFAQTTCSPRAVLYLRRELLRYHGLTLRCVKNCFYKRAMRFSESSTPSFFLRTLKFQFMRVTRLLYVKPISRELFSTRYPRGDKVILAMR